MAGLLAIGLMAGCKPVGPNYNRPGYSAPSAYKETGASTVVPPPNPAGGAWAAANPSDGMLKGKWWEIYQDPQLNRLEERIDPNNVQLRQALETYLAARDQVTVVRAGPLSHVLPGHLGQPRQAFGQPSTCAARQRRPIQRFCDRRPSQLGAGFLGPHPPHRGTGARERAGQRRRSCQCGSHAPRRDGYRLFCPARPGFPDQAAHGHGRQPGTAARPDPAALCRRSGHRGRRGPGPDAA